MDAGQALTLPRALVERIGIDAGRDAWIERLPQTVTDIAERWSLAIDEPFQPGGYCSWVAPARTSAGEAVVLKVGWAHDEAMHEAEGLEMWGGDGTVHLLAAEDIDSTSALLLERCVPGTPLAWLLSEPEQDVVLTGLLRRLWRVPPQSHPFRPLRDMCTTWVAEFRAKNDKDPVDLDAGLVEAGLDLFVSLAAQRPTDVVLCTDLHPENILSAQREPWLAIDPKPYVGDPAYDVLQNMLNMDRVRDGAVALADRMAHLTDLDTGRVRLWAFARFVVESADKPWLKPAIEALSP